MMSLGMEEQEIADPIRTLHCVVGMNRGGLETLKMNLYRKMDRSLVQFDFLVSLKGAYDEEIKELGGRIFYTPFIDKVGPLRYAKNLRDFFIAHPEYTIIHIQMDRFGGFIAKQAKKAGVPYRLLHCDNTLSDGNFIVRTVKNYYGRYINKATHFIACGEDAARWMFHKTDGVKYVRNGVDLNIFTNEDKRDVGAFTIAHVGRFDKVKNHTFLIDIFKEVLKLQPDARLLLVGIGKELTAIQDKVKALNLSSSVEFVGQTSDVASILQRADVFCLPSLHEGLPVTLIEAQACGVPCVVSDAVTKEVKIVKDQFDFISLDEEPKVWAERLLQYKGLIREDNKDILRKAGYDISDLAAEMQVFYLSFSEHK